MTERDWIYLDGRPVSMNATVSAVAAEWGITVEQLLSRRRSADLAWPRQVAMYLCALDARNSFPEIGRHFDRDHTTIMYAERRVERVLASDKREARRVERVMSDLGLTSRERLRHLRAVHNLSTLCGKCSGLENDECVVSSRNIVRLESAQPMERV